MKLTRGDIDSWLSWCFKCKSLKIVFTVLVSTVMPMQSKKFLHWGRNVCKWIPVQQVSPPADVFFTPLFQGLGRGRLLRAAVTMPGDPGNNNRLRPHWSLSEWLLCLSESPVKLLHLTPCLYWHWTPWGSSCIPGDEAAAQITEGPVGLQNLVLMRLEETNLISLVQFHFEI